MAVLTELDSKKEENLALLKKHVAKANEILAEQTEVTFQTNATSDYLSEHFKQDRSARVNAMKEAGSIPLSQDERQAK